MKVSILTLFAAIALFGADEQQLALMLKAQSDFDRVQLAPAPSLRDTSACVQTQAALLTVALPEDLPLVHFRKGYCTLAGAALRHDKADFHAAAAEFDKAIETWPGRAAVMTKKKLPPETVSSGLRVLAQLARLDEGNTDDTTLDRVEKELATAAEVHSCPGSVMTPGLCASLLDVGRQWQGWIELRRGNFTSAAKDFSGTSASGWAAWAQGKYAFRDRNYRDAASHYRKAVTDWQSRRGDESMPLLERLGPPVQLASAYTELGGAQLLAGDKAGAVTTLTQAVKAAPLDSRALYLRARAKDSLGQADAAITDYSLAARTAFANSQDQGSGEGHLYRGILLYRRKSLEQAEEEFSSALNFEIPADLRADAVAWRRMAAVAEGSCGPGRTYLEEALPKVSPYFPSDEARTLMNSCETSARAAGARGIQQ
jgi:tetratricopeptide (TPR) repeat protein